jgi:Ca2+-binding RTX toxin-like protein
MEIDGTDDDDFLFGTDDDDTIRGFAGNDFILCLADDDTLDGGDGDDQLVGSAGNDVLLGGNGDVALTGDTGVEILTGGADNDQFEWDPFGGTSTTLVMDTVTDFEGADDAAGDTLELQSFSSSRRKTHSYEW